MSCFLVLVLSEMARSKIRQSQCDHCLVQMTVVETPHLASQNIKAHPTKTHKENIENMGIVVHLGLGFHCCLRQHRLCHNWIFVQTSVLLTKRPTSDGWAKKNNWPWIQYDSIHSIDDSI